MSVPDRKYPKYPRYILVIFPALDYTVSGIVSSQEHYTTKSASMPFFKGQRHFLFLPDGTVTFFTAPFAAPASAFHDFHDRPVDMDGDRQADQGVPQHIIAVVQDAGPELDHEGPGRGFALSVPENA